MRRRAEAEIAREKAELERKRYLREERLRRPRKELPSSVYSDESIHVHQRIYDGFMKQVGKKFEVESSHVDAAGGGKLVIHYKTRNGTSGRLELFDLGPAPIQ